MIRQILEKTLRTRRLAYISLSLIVVALCIGALASVPLMPLSVFTCFMMMGTAYHVTGNSIVFRFWMGYALIVLACATPVKELVPLFGSPWWLGGISGFCIVAAFLMAILLPSYEEDKPWILQVRAALKASSGITHRQFAQLITDYEGRIILADALKGQPSGRFVDKKDLAQCFEMMGESACEYMLVKHPEESATAYVYIRPDAREGAKKPKRMKP